MSTNVDNLDSVPVQAPRTKTVEGRLLETLYKLAVTEGNLHLFSTLRKLGLSTNDVTNFVSKQASHKKVKLEIDAKGRAAAMKSKIVDASAHAKRLRQEKNLCRQRVLKKYRGNKSLGRKVLDELLTKYRDRKLHEYDKADKKIQFYREKSVAEKSMKRVPSEASELLLGVNIFSPDQNVKPQPPLGPFICHDSIKFSDNEMKILSRGPKFMIRNDLSEEEFKVDIEKMIVKKKYDNCFNEKEDDCREESSGQSTSHTIQSAVSEVNSADFSRVKEQNDKFNLKWEENCGKMTYNIRSKVLDMGNLQATAYKYNKQISLPSNESPELETAHEARRIELLSLFDKVAKDPNYKEPGSESNLSPDELKGLKSLKKRIREGSLVIADTDKSRRFAALTREQYVASGLAHTKNDIEISESKVKRIQTTVNEHTWWLQNMLNCGKNWGHESRMSKNTNDKGEQACPMVLLIKDHKDWSVGSESPPHPDL